MALLLLLALCSIVSGTATISSVHKLVRRLLPKQADQFFFGLSPDGIVDSSLTGYFEISSSPCETSPFGRCVNVTGSDPISVAAGLNHYLKYTANCSVGWWGDQLENIGNGSIPEPQLTRMNTTYQYRYYMNVCTHGYSSFSWDWSRWEREIDWMALNGINMPLAFVGQEHIFAEVFTKDFNLSMEQAYELFSGPAFLPWNRMGNIRSWMGPLPATWVKEQHHLQRQIVKRMREFGMTPVLPAFSGLVPPAMSQVYPNATIVDSSGWVGFPPTNFLDPTDPLFREIQIAFLTRQEKEYGTDHLYNCDLYNEMAPHSMNVEYLRNSTAGVFAAMTAADPDAKWILQGWFLVNGGYWNATTAQAVLHAVPQGRMIILDMWADVEPIWVATESFYETPFIWNMLHNFGGRSGLYGRLPQIATNPAEALATNSSTGMLIGLGLTPESIETNPVVYDLMMENVWRGTEGVKNLSQWMYAYVSRRYAGSIPSEAREAWSILQTTVYSCNTSQQGTSGSIFASFPGFTLTEVSCCAPIQPYYNTSELNTAFALLLQAGSNTPTLPPQTTYQFDLVMTASQCMSNLGLHLHQQAVTAFIANNTAEFVGNSTLFLELIQDLDALVGTQSLFLFGEWIANATRWAVTNNTNNASCPIDVFRFDCGATLQDSCTEVGCCWDESIPNTPWCFRTFYTNDSDVMLLSLNARAQVTTWGPEFSTLTEYAYKLWNGIIIDYYYPRWQQWTAAVIDALQNHQSFDSDTFNTNLQYWQQGWVYQEGNAYPMSPQGDAYTLAQQIFVKYFA